MYILAIGASRNIGYFSSLRLLAEGHTVTFLLRNPSVFDADAEIQKYIQEGKAKCVKGDATIRADIKSVVDAAWGAGQLDVVLFCLGGTPAFSLTKGFVITPPNLCSSSMQNLLVCYPVGTPTTPQPKLIVISSNGLTKTSHNNLPLMWKPLYSYFLQGPHADKIVMERAIYHASNRTWQDEEPKDTAEFLGSDWKEQMKDPGFLKNVVLVRPTLFTDSKGKPVREYRTATDKLPNAYFITREEVAHFVVEGALKNWEKWVGQGVIVSH